MRHRLRVLSCGLSEIEIYTLLEVQKKATNEIKREAFFESVAFYKH